MMSLVYLFSPPERIGEAIGLRIMALNLGKSVFPVLAGLLGNWIGAGSTIWCLAAFAAGGCGYAAHRALEDEGAQGRENRWMSPG